jgi:MFS family permease
MLKKLHTPLGVVFTTLLIDKLGENIIYPLLPFILAAYKPDALTLGVVASVGTLFAVLTGPVVGSLSDSLGRRTMVLICIGLNTISLLMFGWAGSLLMVLISRSIFGIGSSTMGTLQAYITDISDSKNRARNLGISGAAFGLGAIAGPALGGGLIGLGVKVPIFVAAGLSGYNLLAAFLFLRESIPPEKKKPPRWSSLNIVRPIKRILTQPVVNRVALAFACFNLAFAAFTSLLVLALKDQFGWTPAQTSGLFVVVGVTLTYAQVALIGRFVGLLGEFRLNRVGMILVSTGIMFIPLATTAGAFETTIIIFAGIILALGAAFVLPTARSLIAGLVPSDQQGVTLGSLTSLTGLASAIGPIAAGWVYDRSTLACFAMEASACLLGVVLLGQTPKSVTAQAES